MWAPVEKALGFVKWHYSDVTLRRSEKQILREEKLLWLIPFNRWMLVPAACFVQLSIGSLYAWSIYNVPIETELGLAAGTAANTFYIAVFFFGFSAAIFGPVLERQGPAITLVCSTTTMWCGYMLAAIGAWQESMGCIYVGYGVLGGIGFGVSYITPVSPLQKWFPDYKGLLSGLAVCGFGGGSMIASKVENVIITEYNVATCFVILGCSYAVVMYACCFVLRCPPPGYYVESPEERKKRQEHEAFLAEYRGAPVGMNSESVTNTMAAEEVIKKNSVDAGGPVGGIYDVNTMPETASVALKEPEMKFTLLEGLFNRDYACMYVTLMANSCAGLMILSKMSDIMQQQFGQTKDFASNVVMINSGFNLLGRLVYGAMSDRIGQKPIFVTSLAAQAIIMGILPTLIQEQQMWVFISLIWILASFYGGGFGLMPAFLTAQFGSNNIGALHGIILTGWSIVGIVGGLSFTAIFKDQVNHYAAEGGKKNPNVYNINFYTICAFIIIGFFVSILIRTSMRDRMMPRQQGEILKVPFFGKPLVFSYKTRTQQNDDWAAYLRTLPQNQAGALTESATAPINTNASDSDDRMSA